MTKEIIHICDHCDAEIKDESERVNIRGELTIYGPDIEKNIEVDKDLCLNCARESFERNVIVLPIEPRLSVRFEEE